MSEELIEETTPKFETMFSTKYRKQGIDIGNPKIKKYGQELDVREWINENNIDCEIYSTLEKYGTIKEKSINSAQIVGEMENLDLRKYLDRKIAEENLWKSLPINIRKEFSNDPNEFMERGLDYMKEKRDEEIAKLNPPEPTPTIPEPTIPETGEGA